MSRQLVCNDGAGGGGRTHMPSEGRGILSPVRLPVPPLRQRVGSFEFTLKLLQATQVKSPGNLRCGLAPTVRRYPAARRASNFCAIDKIEAAWAVNTGMVWRFY